MTEIFSSIIVSFWVSIHSIDWSYDFFGVKEIEFKNQSSRRFKGTAATYHLSKISTSEDCRLLFITCIALLLLFSTLMGACEQKLHSMVNHTTHLLAAHQVRLKKKKRRVVDSSCHQTTSGAPDSCCCQFEDSTLSSLPFFLLFFGKLLPGLERVDRG